MIFKNASSAQVLFTLGQKQILIAPKETIDIDCCSNPFFCLGHTYRSTSMSLNEIKQDDLSFTSIVDVMIAGHRPPYFHIVLDSEYRLECSENATVTLRRERLRPCYACEYDRIYPYVDEGDIKELSCTFQEKPAFTKLYLDAVGKSNKNILRLLIIVMIVFSVPCIGLVLLSNVIVGIALLLLGMLLFGSIYFAGRCVADAIARAECRTVLTDFESDRIMLYYRRAKANASYEIMCD